MIEHDAMQKLADHKQLPVKFLTNELGITHDYKGYHIPYRDVCGMDLRERIRPGVSIADGGIYWGPGEHQHVYGAWLHKIPSRERRVLLVEGESDCWALWHHGFPALGIPGAQNAKVLRREHLDCIDAVYVHQEPDNAGRLFVQNCRDALKELKFEGDVYVFKCWDGKVKDPSEMHCESPEKFIDRMNSVLALSRQVEWSLRRASEQLAELLAIDLNGLMKKAIEKLLGQKSDSHEYKKLLAMHFELKDEHAITARRLDELESMMSELTANADDTTYGE